jgi:hypothetical protein
VTSAEASFVPPRSSAITSARCRRFLFANALTSSKETELGVDWDTSKPPGDYGE